MTQGRLEDLLKENPAGERLFKLNYTAPCKDIYRFDAKFSQIKNRDETTLDLKQFLPRGAVIKNSKEVYAMVIYTGRDTKLVMNQGNTPSRSADSCTYSI